MIIGIAAVIAGVIHVVDVVEVGKWTIKSAVVFGLLIGIAVNSFLHG